MDSLCSVIAIIIVSLRAVITQVVECQIRNLEVRGSSPLNGTTLFRLRAVCQLYKAKL